MPYLTCHNLSTNVILFLCVETYIRSKQNQNVKRDIIWITKYLDVFITDKSLIDKMVFVFNPNLVMVMINVDKVRKK